MTLVLKTDWKLWLRSEQAEWNLNGELIADVSKEFRPGHGNLSLYQVNDNVSKERVASALEKYRLRNRDSNNPSNVDFILIDDSVLTGWGYELEPAPDRTTGDAEVDKTHHHVTHLTLAALCELAIRLWDVARDDQAVGVTSATVPAAEIRNRI